MAPDDDFDAIASADHAPLMAAITAVPFDLAAYHAAIDAITGETRSDAERVAKRLGLTLGTARIGEASRVAIEAAVRVGRTEGAGS